MRLDLRKRKIEQRNPPCSKRNAMCRDQKSYFAHCTETTLSVATPFYGCGIDGALLRNAKHRKSSSAHCVTACIVHIYVNVDPA